MIMRRTGLAARDMRILLSPRPATTIGGRERAIVINLEHIKGIITAHELLLLNSTGDPSLPPFLDFLHHRIQSSEGNRVDSNMKEAQDSEEAMQHHDGMNVKAKRRQDSIKILPFEFVALEACLEDACTTLENEATMLNKEARAALDELTTNISTLNLERVRQIKSRLVAITNRVQKVKDELEKLLDYDDEDMSEMYLTNKLVQQHPLEPHSGDMENQVLQPAINHRTTSHPEVSSEPSGSGCSAAVTNKPDLQVLVIFLGAYLVQIRGTLNKLFALSEYVDDTEDYIKTMLDDKQNKLLQVDMLVSTGDMILKAFITVATIFAINIHMGMFDKNGNEERMAIGGAAASLFLFLAALAWYKYKHLLD